MDRRKVLLIAAAMVAVLGVALVFLYVRGADNRAEERFETVDVLVAVAPIAAGESIDDAATAGKLDLEAVAQDNMLPNAQTTIDSLSGQVATTTIYPGEQIIPDKFGAAAEAAAAQSALQLQKGLVAISVNLTDTSRVAGFINPGSEVAVWLNGTSTGTGQPYTRVLLPRVQVAAIGSTTTTTTTTTTAEGAQTTEQLPKTLFTLALPQRDAEKVLFAQTAGELVLGVIGETPVKPTTGITAADLFSR